MELVKGAWTGETVSIIGGGPSLKGFDFATIPPAHKLIAINRAVHYVPWSDICFSEDIRFIEHFAEELNQGFGRHIVWHCLKGIDAERGIKACPRIKIIRELRDDKYWSSEINSLSFSSNSAVGAINLAEILGAKHIYVLGLDCRSDGPFLDNFHSDYPQGWQVTGMNAQSWKSDFEHWVAPNCKVPITNVINPYYESTIESWPKITLYEYTGC